MSLSANHKGALFMAVAMERTSSKYAPRREKSHAPLYFKVSGARVRTVTERGS